MIRTLLSAVSGALSPSTPGTVPVPVYGVGDRVRVTAGAHEGLTGEVLSRDIYFGQYEYYVGDLDAIENDPLQGRWNPDTLGSGYNYTADELEIISDTD